MIDIKKFLYDLPCLGLSNDDLFNIITEIINYKNDWNFEYRIFEYITDTIFDDDIFIIPEDEKLQKLIDKLARHKRKTLKAYNEYGRD